MGVLYGTRQGAGDQQGQRDPTGASGTLAQDAGATMPTRRCASWFPRHICTLLPVRMPSRPPGRMSPRASYLGLSACSRRGLSLYTAELLTGVEAASSRPVRRIVLREE